MRIPSLVTRRRIEGISAVLLPFDDAGEIDWAGFRTLVERTWAAGLTPAVNMDTGYVNLLSAAERARVLADTAALAAGRRFVAGAFIEGEAGDPVPLYRREIEAIRLHGGLPIVFQSTGLTRGGEAATLDIYTRIGEMGGPLLAFELGTMFAPFGRIYSIDCFRRLLDIEAFTGLKHSSLDRACEWDRLAIRDAHRPDFRVYTGNDLAIDMVFYGSDYLLGLSAFAVEAFALRDRCWEAGDRRAFAVNDVLQYLGQLAFRAPVPAYKHSAAQFLKLRGVIASDRPHPKGGTRPDADIPLLADIRDRLDRAFAGAD